MVITSFPTLYHVLCLADHGGAARENEMHGGPLGQRMLNVTGRWAAGGTTAVPLLVWSSLEEATAGANQAAAARGRSVVVRQAGGTDFDRVIVPFAPQHSAALTGYLPYAAVAARKLEVERKKLMGYANVMLAAGVHNPTEDPAVAVEAMKATARNLRGAGIGNGSWVSAAQALTGKRARDLAAQILEGELACDPGVTPADILKAIVLAQLWAPKP